MAAQREQVLLPSDTSPGQMVGAWSTLLARFAYEWGEILDSMMTSKFGPGWTDEIERQRSEPGRRFRFDRHDPTFVLGEPVKHDSIIRSVLPSTVPWRAHFNAVRHRRNDWVHRKCAWDLDSLEAAIEDLQELVRVVSPGLPVATDVGTMLARIFELRQSGGAIPDPQVIELEALLDEARAEAARAQREVSAMAAKLTNLAERDSALVGLKEELHRARSDAAAAQERLAKLREEIRTRAEDDHAHPVPLPTGIAPGDPWPVARGTRHLRLQAAPAIGLFDLDEMEYVAGDMQETAAAAASRWLEVMPNGGDIWVNDSWQAAGYVGLTLTYLGKLDADPVQDETVGAPVVGLLTPRRYELVDGILRSALDHVSLSDAIGARAAEPVLQTIRGAVEMLRSDGPPETDPVVDIRSTYDHVIAATIEDEHVFVCRVLPEQWFPEPVQR